LKPEPTSNAAGTAHRWWELAGYCRGLELINTGHYFDAHETLEDVWRELKDPERQFLQGLIQIAVALHHYSTGNLEGAQSVMARAAGNLAPYGNTFGNIELGALRAAVEQWRLALVEGGTEAPQVRVIISS
jgi:predicted metal-dependent hydrolase